MLVLVAHPELGEPEGGLLRLQEGPGLGELAVVGWCRVCVWYGWRRPPNGLVGKVGGCSCGRAGGGRNGPPAEDGLGDGGGCFDGGTSGGSSGSGGGNNGGRHSCMPRRTCPMPTKTNCPVSRTMILAASAAQRRESSTVSVAWPRIRPSRGAVVSRFCERPIEEF